MSVEEDLKILETKLNQLKLDYDRYFLGTRPREPGQLRSEVQKIIVQFSNSPIQNTAQRFRFNSICSRYQAFKRRWDETLRQMEEGTYQGHRFRARMRENPAPAPREKGGDDLYTRYVEARRGCGQDVSRLTRERLDQVISRERAALEKRYPDGRFDFRVVVENGKARLKARKAGRH